MKQLKLLLSLRAWLKSGTLKAGGLVGALGAIQVYLSSKDGVDLVALAAAALGVMPATLGGLLATILAVGIAFMRAKTEWSLKEKVTGVPDPSPGTPT